MLALIFAVGVTAADPHLVVTAFREGFDRMCTQHNCADAIEKCEHAIGDGGSQCAERLHCVRKIDTKDENGLEGCYHETKWSDLKHDEIKVFDCAYHNQCLKESPEEDGAMSLLQMHEELHSRGMADAESVSVARTRVSATQLLHKAQMKMLELHEQYMKDAAVNFARNHALMEAAAQNPDAEISERQMEQAHVNMLELQQGLANQMKILSSLGGNTVDTKKELGDFSSDKLKELFSTLAEEQAQEKTDDAQVDTFAHKDWAAEAEKAMAIPEKGASLVQVRKSGKPEDAASRLSEWEAEQPKGSVDKPMETEYQTAYQKSFAQEKAALKKEEAKMSVDAAGNLRVDK